MWSSSSHTPHFSLFLQKKLFYPHNGYPSIFYKHSACLPHLLSCHPHAVCFDSTVFLLFGVFFLPLHSGCIWSSFYSFRRFSLFFTLSYLHPGFWFTSGVLMWSIGWKGQTAGCLFVVDMWRCSVLSKVSSGTFLQNVMEGWSLLICTFRVWCQRSCSHGGFFQWASPGPDCSSCHQMQPPPQLLCSLLPRHYHPTAAFLALLAPLYLRLLVHHLSIHPQSPVSPFDILFYRPTAAIPFGPPHASFPHSFLSVLTVWGHAESGCRETEFIRWNGVWLISSS